MEEAINQLAMTRTLMKQKSRIFNQKKRDKTKHEEIGSYNKYSQIENLKAVKKLDCDGQSIP
jgi:hypothetical protein